MPAPSRHGEGETILSAGLMGAMVSARGFHIGCTHGHVLVPAIQSLVASVFVLTNSQGEISIRAQISPAITSPRFASICRGGELLTTPLSILHEVCVNMIFGGSHSISQLLWHQDIVVLTEQRLFQSLWGIICS